MKIITTKVMLNILAINIIYIIIGYFGWLDTTGYINKVLYQDEMLTGTPTEYWRVTLSYYFSVTYIMLPILNIITIMLYTGSGETSQKVATALKVQIVLLILIKFLTTSNFLTQYSEELITDTKSMSFEYYYIIISILSVLFVYRKDLKNIKMIATISVSFMLLTLLMNLHVNILRVNMYNRVIEAISKYTTAGTPVIKAKVNLLNVEFYNDGLMSVERSSNDYKDFMGLFIYVRTNKPSNDEIFKIVETFYAKYETINNEYLKEKLGKYYEGTKVGRYNRLLQHKDNDLHLLDVYKNKGLAVAMNEIEKMKKDKKQSIIYLFIKTVENVKELENPFLI